MARYIALSLNSLRAIRCESGYRARSYNRARQVLGLIDHVFVRYPVPLFLYRSMLTYDGLELVFDEKHSAKDRKGRHPYEFRYRDWFQAVAQGASFARVSKDFFTKREAHWFLQAPEENTIEQNVLWAKAAAAGLPREGCAYLVNRLDVQFLKRLGQRFPDLLKFFAEEWTKMRPYDRDEIFDFIRNAVTTDPNFSLKGRTFGSLRKLSYEWHRTMYSGSLGPYRSWTAMLPPWEHQRKGTTVRANEVTNNRALVDEGKKQHHCVYTYTSRCLQNLSRIVSMRWYAAAAGEESSMLELTRLTLEVEVVSRKIVQIRGRQNRRPSDEEMKFVRLWAGTHGLTICQWA